MVNIFPLFGHITLRLRDGEPSPISPWTFFLFQLDMSKKKDDHISLNIDYLHVKQEDQRMIRLDMCMLLIVMKKNALPWLTEVHLSNTPCIFSELDNGFKCPKPPLFFDALADTCLTQLHYPLMTVQKNWSLEDEVALLNLPLHSLWVQHRSGRTVHDLWTVWKDARKNGQRIRVQDTLLSKTCRVIGLISDEEQPLLSSLCLEILNEFPNVHTVHCPYLFVDNETTWTASIQNHPSLLIFNHLNLALNIEATLVKRRQQWVVDEYKFMDSVLPVEVSDLRELVYHYGSWCVLKM